MVSRPKYVVSSAPYGLEKNLVTSKLIREDCLVTSEFWEVSPKPSWKIGEVIIARKGFSWKTRWELGKHYVLTHFYNELGFLLGSYWDITSQVIQSAGSFSYYDWYLDIWIPSGEKPVLLDEDEFIEAVQKGYLSLKEADEARWTVYRVMELVG